MSWSLFHASGAQTKMQNPLQITLEEALLLFPGLPRQKIQKELAYLLFENFSVYERCFPPFRLKLSSY